MGKYANWEDFCALFPGRISEEEFSGAIAAAEMYIDVLTGGRAEKAQGYAKERLKAAACALAEEMAGEKASGQGEAQLEEVSVDGYREKYRVPDEMVSDKTERWDAIVRRWLRGTGLVSAI